MSINQNPEILRYELESYVAATHSDISVGPRQSDAMQKMMELPEANFRSLVLDVVNEIHRRNNMPYSAPDTQMRIKLRKVREEGFRNLVLDVLLVWNQRYPSTDNTAGLMDNLDRLITSLREDIVSEEKIYNESNIVRKTLLFSQYMHAMLKKNGEDTKLTQYMIGKLREYEDQDAFGGLSMVFDMELFLKQCDESPHSNRAEYKYHRENIRRLIHQRMDEDTKRMLLTEEVARIYGMVSVSDTDLCRAKRTQMENEVVKLADALDRIKEEILEGGSPDMEQHSGFIVNASKALYSVFENDEKVKEGDLERLKTQIEAVESNEEKREGIHRVFSAIDTIREILDDSYNDG
jgi:hypothetical protein